MRITSDRTDLTTRVLTVVHLCKITSKFIHSLIFSLRGRVDRNQSPVT